LVALHHRGKSESSNYRGSTDILGAVDVGFKLSRTDDGLLELTTVGVKNRVGPNIRLTIRPDFATGQFPVVEFPALVTTRHEMEMVGNVIRETPGLSANKIIERSGMSRQRVFGLHSKAMALPRNGKMDPKNPIATTRFNWFRLPEFFQSFGTSLVCGSHVGSKRSEPVLPVLTGIGFCPFIGQTSGPVRPPEAA
jgi:hypothetical protein